MADDQHKLQPTNIVTEGILVDSPPPSPLSRKKRTPNRSRVSFADDLERSYDVEADERSALLPRESSPVAENEDDEDEAIGFTSRLHRKLKRGLVVGGGHQRSTAGEDGRDAYGREDEDVVSPISLTTVLLGVVLLAGIIAIAFSVEYYGMPFRMYD